MHEAGAHLWAREEAIYGHGNLLKQRLYWKYKVLWKSGESFSSQQRKCDWVRTMKRQKRASRSCTGEAPDVMKHSLRRGNSTGHLPVSQLLSTKSQLTLKSPYLSYLLYKPRKDQKDTGSNMLKVSEPQRRDPPHISCPLQFHFIY